MKTVVVGLTLLVEAIIYFTLGFILSPIVWVEMKLGVYSLASRVYVYILVYHIIVCSKLTMWCTEEEDRAWVAEIIRETWSDTLKKVDEEEREKLYEIIGI